MKFGRYIRRRLICVGLSIAIRLLMPGGLL